MLNPDKIKIMTRLAMMEKHYGRELEHIESSYWIDRVTNPVWLNAVRMTVVYLIGLGIWSVSNMNELLDAFADDQLAGLISRAVIVYLIVLVFTIVATLIISWRKNRVSAGLESEYKRLLAILLKMEEREGGDL